MYPLEISRFQTPKHHLELRKLRIEEPFEKLELVVIYASIDFDTTVIYLNKIIVTCIYMYIKAGDNTTQVNKVTHSS